MSSDFNEETLATYRATAQKRWMMREEERKARRQRAWTVVQQAVSLLKRDFGATRVLVFGSMVTGRRFELTSDIDLAVWGVQGEDYLVAVAKLQDLDPGFKIDLVSSAYCKPSLTDAILAEGIEL
ncbi:MAG: nucleotidyltransferase domain-containing protein [Chloroflexi bacterium]|nr:nucleotidyltransferase domain-containing protein [Chloroflexota bacterium]